MLQTLGNALTPQPATDEEQLMAFQRLLSDSFFENSLLAELLNTKKLASITHVKSFGKMVPTHKLFSTIANAHPVVFSQLRPRPELSPSSSSSPPPPLPVYKPAPVSRRPPSKEIGIDYQPEQSPAPIREPSPMSSGTEAKVLTEMMETVLGRLISQTNKEPRNFPKLVDSLLNTIRNNLENFKPKGKSKGKGNEANYQRVRRNPHQVQLMARRMLELLERQGYLKVTGANLEVILATFQNYPNLRLSPEDLAVGLLGLGADHLSAVPRPDNPIREAPSLPVSRSQQLVRAEAPEECKLSEGELRLADRLCDTFVRGCVQNKWYLMQKLQSLMNHFHNYAANARTSNPVPGPAEPRSRELQIQSQIVEKILQILVAKGFISIDKNGVTYYMPAFAKANANDSSAPEQPHVRESKPPQSPLVKEPAPKDNGSPSDKAVPQPSKDVKAVRYVDVNISDNVISASLELEIEAELIRKLKANPERAPGTIQALYMMVQQVAWLLADGRNCEQQVNSVMKRLLETEKVCSEQISTFTPETLKKFGSSPIFILLG